MIYRLMLACTCASLLAPTVTSAQAPDYPVIHISGPVGLIEPVLKKFGVNPVVIDTTNGRRISLFYVDGPYTQLSPKRQSAQAEAIARFVWSLPARPVGTDTISVSFEHPMRTMGDTGWTRAFSFDGVMFFAAK